MDPVPEGPGGEPGQLPDVAVRERDDHAVRGEAHALQGVGQSAGLGLVAVHHNGGAGGLQPRDRLTEGLIQKTVEPALVDPPRREVLETVEHVAGPGDAADRFGGNAHAHEPR